MSALFEILSHFRPATEATEATILATLTTQEITRFSLEIIAQRWFSEKFWNRKREQKISSISKWKSDAMNDMQTIDISVPFTGNTKLNRFRWMHAESATTNEKKFNRKLRAKKNENSFSIGILWMRSGNHTHTHTPRIHICINAKRKMTKNEISKTWNWENPKSRKFLRLK